MVFAYNLEKKPPRPECSLIVSNPLNSETITINNAIADTGADITWIPQSIIDNLNPPYTEETVKMRTVTETREQTRRIYSVNIKIAGYQLDNIEVMTSPGNTTLIGRDILNNYKISFDGRINKWQLNCIVNCNENSSS